MQAALRAGEVIGEKYRIIAERPELRRFEAEDTTSGQRVALQVLPNRCEPKAIDRLRRDAQAVRRLRHSNIINVLDVGQHGELLYIVDELREGKLLHNYIAGRTFSHADALDLLVPIMHSVAEANNVGVFHGRLTPHSLLVASPAGASVTLFLRDLGISRLSPRASDGTIQTQMLGEYEGLSPECLVGSSTPTARADVYGLAALLYRLLTGHAPVEAANAIDLALRVAQSSPTPIETHAPEVPPSLAQVLEGALAYDPKIRPLEVREFVRGLAPFFANGENEALRRLLEVERTAYRTWHRDDLLAALADVRSSAEPHKEVEKSARSEPARPQRAPKPAHGRLAKDFLGRYWRFALPTLVLLILGACALLLRDNAKTSPEPRPSGAPPRPVESAPPSEASPSTLNDNSDWQR
jgi:serine/threonine protein kinase